MIYTTHYSSPIGKLLLAEKDDALVGLWIGDGLTGILLAKDRR